MRYKYLILGLVILMSNTLSAQKKFSFLDCISTSISGGYNFGYYTTVDENVKLDNLYIGDQEESALRVRNYPFYSIESTYFLKAYRNLRLGFGGEFTHREVFFEYISTPKSIGVPTIITKHDRKFKVFGPSISIAYAIPKWKLRITYHYGYLFVKYRRIYDDDNSNVYYNYYYSNDNVAYLDGYKIGIRDFDEGSPVKIPVSAFVNGLEIHYRIEHKIYFLLKFRQIISGFALGIQHRRYEEINGVEKEYEVGTAGIQSGARYQIGVGIAYHFFDKG